MNKCSYDGCPNPCFIDPLTNQMHPYCSRQHGKMDKQIRQNLPSSSCIAQEFQKVQTVFPYDIVLIETCNGNNSSALDEITLKLKMLIDFIPVQVSTPNQVLSILQSKHARRVLCCINSSDFTIASSLFPIFHFKECDLILRVANLFREKVDTIYFYNNDELYFHLTNFFELPEQVHYNIGNGLYKSTEHYFQSKKFSTMQHQIQILQTSTPREAFSVGRSLNNYKIPNWNNVRDAVMREALMAKISILEFNILLYFTGNARLIEHTENDNYWADGGFQINGTGINRLGQMWMELRQQNQQHFSNSAQLDQFFASSIFFNYSKAKMMKKSVPKEFQQMKALQMSQLQQFNMTLQQYMVQQQYAFQHQYSLSSQNTTASSANSIQLARKPVPPTPSNSKSFPYQTESSLYPSVDDIVPTPEPPACAICKVKPCLYDHKHSEFLSFCSKDCQNLSQTISMGNQPYLF